MQQSGHSSGSSFEGSPITSTKIDLETFIFFFFVFSTVLTVRKLRFSSGLSRMP